MQHNTVWLYVCVAIVIIAVIWAYRRATKRKDQMDVNVPGQTFTNTSPSNTRPNIPFAAIQDQEFGNDMPKRQTPVIDADGEDDVDAPDLDAIKQEIKATGSMDYQPFAVASASVPPLSVTKEMAEADVHDQPTTGFTENQTDEFLEQGVFPAPPETTQHERKRPFSKDEIRSIRSSTKSNDVIADEWSVTSRTIQRIRDRETYKNYF